MVFRHLGGVDHCFEASHIWVKELAFEGRVLHDRFGKSTSRRIYVRHSAKGMASLWTKSVDLVTRL